MRAKLAVLAAGLALAGLPAWAHHSFAVEFDAKQPVQITGVVTKVDWSNPHAYFTLEVPDATGATVTWICQTGSPHALTMRGWLQDTVKVGDTLTVDAYRARDGSPFVNVSSAAFMDGRRLWAGTSRDASQR